MDINLGSITWLWSGFTVAGSCKQWNQNLFAQHDETRHRSQALRGWLVESRVLDPPDQVLPTKLLQIVRSMPSMIIGDGIAKDFFDSSCKLRRCEASRIDRETHDPFHHGSHSRPIDINPSNSGLPHLRGKGPVIQSSVVDVGNVYPPQHLQKPLQDAHEQGNHLGKATDPFPTVQLLGVVNNHLDSQDALAFAIHLDRQFPEMNFEDRQIIDRSLDHGLTSRRGSLFLPLEEWTMLGAKDGLDHLEVQGGSRSINDTLKHLIQVAPSREEKVATIFALVDRIGIDKSTLALLPTFQSKAQTSINPTLTGPNQAPYRARGSHGVCDSGQACGVGDLCKTVPLFGEGDFTFLGLTGYIFMTVKDHLSIKGWMRTEFDHEVTPFGVHDVEGIMIDVAHLGFDVGDALLGALDLEHWHRCQGSDDAEDTSEGRVLGNMLFGQFVLALPSLTVNQGNTLLLRISMNPSAKATRKPHEMGIVEILIASSHLTPPGSESSGGLGKDKIGIEYNAIDTIINSGKIRLIRLREFIGHLHRSFLLDMKHRIGEVIDEVNGPQRRKRSMRSYP